MNKNDILKTKKLPVTFQKINTVETEDLRFTKVKIWLMHTGVNFNSSIFEEQSIINAIPSLSNTPILGYVENDDFSDHRREIVKDENGVTINKYLGKAFGVIPETNNAQFEYRVCDDGIERKFLTVEGLLWNKFEEVDILERDGGIKSQSMELHDDIDGYVEDNGLFNFTDFKFDGACILGDEVEPAMINSTVEIVETFAKLRKDFAVEIKNKLEMFQKIEETEGGNSKVNKSELFKKFSITEEEVKEKGIETEALSFEELEEKLKEITEESSVKDEEPSEFSKVVESLQIEDKDVIDIKEGSIVYSLDGDIVKQSFSIEEDKVEISEDKVKAVFMTDDEIRSAKDSISEFEKQNETLKEEKSELESKLTDMTAKVEDLESKISEFETKDKQERVDSLFAQYESLKGISEFEALKEKALEFGNMEDLEKEIALIYVKNAQSVSFSKKSPETKIGLDNPVKDDSMSEYGDLFDKYGN